MPPRFCRARSFRDTSLFQVSASGNTKQSGWPERAHLMLNTRNTCSPCIGALRVSRFRCNLQGFTNYWWGTVYVEHICAKRHSAVNIEKMHIDLFRCGGMPCVSAPDKCRASTNARRSLNTGCPACEWGANRIPGHAGLAAQGRRVGYTGPSN
jgi:hypothetical protein